MTSFEDRGKSRPGEVTVLLHAWREGEPEAFDRLFPLVYDELRRVARGQLRRARRGVTLDTVALVHEAYLKMAGQDELDLQDRSHLLAVTARAMRQVIVDLARSRAAAKRGGDVAPVTLDEERLGAAGRSLDVLDVDRALDRLAEHDERMARVVECRFFAGMSEEETAAALEVSLRTVQRDWKKARAWLEEFLAREDRPS